MGCQVRRRRRRPRCACRRTATAVSYFARQAAQEHSTYGWILGLGSGAREHSIYGCADHPEATILCLRLAGFSSLTSSSSQNVVYAVCCYQTLNPK